MKSSFDIMKIAEDKKMRNLLEAQKSESEAKEQWEEKRVASQELITAESERLSGLFKQMPELGNDMQRVQEEMAKVEEEQANLNYAVDDAYPTTPLDESKIPIMKFHRMVYHLLPIMDAIFAWFAISPLFTSKLFSNPAIASAAPILGAISSIGVGWGLSTLSRMACSTIKPEEKSIHKKLLVFVSALILPIFYIVSQLVFEDSHSWGYTIGFAFVSLVIQCIIISGYRYQMEAISFLVTLKENRKQEKALMEHRQMLASKVDALKGKTEQIVESFKSVFQEFHVGFGHFPELLARHKDCFGEQARYYMDNLALLFGNWAVFHEVVVPFMPRMAYENIPNQATMSDVRGFNDLYTNTDFVKIRYMLEWNVNAPRLSEILGSAKQQPLIQG